MSVRPKTPRWPLLLYDVISPQQQRRRERYSAQISSFCSAVDHDSTGATSRSAERQADEWNDYNVERWNVSSQAGSKFVPSRGSGRRQRATLARFESLLARRTPRTSKVTSHTSCDFTISSKGRTERTEPRDPPKHPRKGGRDLSGLSGN
jgi:hypothetical protein